LLRSTAAHRLVVNLLLGESMTVMRNIKQVVGMGILLLAVGCATTGNLPHRAQVVGGGLQIDWDPPTDGTAILVERTTGKPVATRSVSPGFSFTFDVARQSDAEVLEAVFFDSMPTNAHFVLYFVPASRRY
jgi:hypothetical protein